MITQYSDKFLIMMQQGNGGLTKKGSVSVAGKKKTKSNLIEQKRQLNKKMNLDIANEMNKANKKPRVIKKNLDKSTQELDKQFNKIFSI